MKLISPRFHGYLDFVVVALFALAPTLFGLTGVPMVLAYVLAAIHLTLTLTTAFPIGLLKLVPFPVHGWLELAVSLFLASAPWFLGFADQTNAKIFYVASGILIFGVFMTTDYTAAQSDPASQPKPSPT